MRNPLATKHIIRFRKVMSPLDSLMLILFWGAMGFLYAYERITGQELIIFFAIFAFVISVYYILDVKQGMKMKKNKQTRGH